MPVTLRAIQTYEPAHEDEFLALERRFAELERSRPDLPKGRRHRVMAGPQPVHTLVWECDFADPGSAWAEFGRYCDDPDHLRLAALQRPYLRQATVEMLASFA